MGLITRLDKLRLMAYYQSGKCLCGQRKRKRHWSCRPCKHKMAKTEEASLLDAACNNHVYAIHHYLEGIKKNVA